MKNLMLAFCLIFTVLGYSQTPLNPVTWSVNYVETSATEGEIVFKATIEKKWHIYSQKPTDAGPIPTSFTITPNSNYELVGKVVENNAHEEYVAAFDAKVFVFAGVAIFKQKIKLKNKNEFKVNTLFEYMSCNDMMCLPPKTVEMQVSVSSKK